MRPSSATLCTDGTGNRPSAHSKDHTFQLIGYVYQFGYWLGYWANFSACFVFSVAMAVMSVAWLYSPIVSIAILVETMISVLAVSESRRIPCEFVGYARSHCLRPKVVRVSLFSLHAEVLRSGLSTFSQSSQQHLFLTSFFPTKLVRVTS